jgi:ADP-ribose pyrophosphatase YjhB (NUDIX family)
VAERGQRRAKIAALILPLRDGEVLLARHSYGPPVWAMLGGMAEEGEAPHVTAEREVTEECGLSVTAERLVAVCDRGELLLFIFTGRVQGGHLARQPEEIEELRWFTPAALAGVDVYDLIPVLLERVLASDGAEQGLALGQIAWFDATSYPVYAP